MIKVLNNPNLTPNFKLDEIKCKCGCDTVVVNFKTMLLLQALRDHFGKPIRIVSGTRCENHNKAVGGAPQSKHMQGIACDIKVADVHPEDVARVAAQVGFNGIGVYTNNGNMFTHVDTRDAKRVMWRDQKGTHELVTVNSPYIWR